MALINKPSGMNKIWAEGGTAIAPLDEKINLGWVVEAPPHQTENWINKKHDQALASINQLGFFLWDDVTEYRANLSWVLGSNGAIYFCKVTNTNNDPVTDVAETYWRKVLDGNAALTFPLVSAFIRTNLFPAADAAAARTALGMTTVGNSVVTSTTQANARTALGSGAVGDSVFVATSQINARTAIGVVDADDTTKGLVQRATDAEAIAGVEDTKFLTSKKLKLGFSITLGSNGQITFPSWLGSLSYRWGQVTLSAGQQFAVTTFPTQCFQGSAVNNAIGTAGGDGAMRCAPSGVSLIVTNPESSTRTIGWTAVGY